MATIFRSPTTYKYELPFPRRAVLDSQLSVWQNPLLTLLKSKDTFFTGAGCGPDYDYPNPIAFHPLARSQPSISLKTHIDPLKLTLLNQDKFFGDAGQAPANLDWPVPKGYSPNATQFTWLYSLLSSTLRPVVLPFNLLDWPVPRGPVHVNSLKTHIDQLRLNLLGQDQFFNAPGEPPANTDWPVPKGPQYAIILRTHIDPLKLNLRSKDQFFAAAGMGPTYDYPNPRGKEYPSSLRTFTDNLKVLLQSKDQFYGAPGEPPPNTDFPNPRGPEREIDLLTHTDPLKLNLASLDKFFGLAGNPTFDFPNPKGPSHVLFIVLNNNLLQTTLGPTPVPPVVTCREIIDIINIDDVICIW